MKKSFYKLTLVSCLLALSACDKLPTTSSTKGSPEALIDVSSETVTLSLNSKNSLSKLSGTIAKDFPSRADLNCSLKNSKCLQAKKILDRNSIPARLTGASSANSIVLSYKRTVVRDCNPRYADTINDSGSDNQASFGCAISGNIVQMVGNKKQFTEPALSDFPDAEKGVQTYKQYIAPLEKPTGVAVKYGFDKGSSK
jgi:type IV pilus biogenesis protein CpaD/CtpE